MSYPASSWRKLKVLQSSFHSVTDRSWQAVLVAFCFFPGRSQMNHFNSTDPRRNSTSGKPLLHLQWVFRLLLFLFHFPWLQLTSFLFSLVRLLNLCGFRFYYVLFCFVLFWAGDQGTISSYFLWVPKMFLIFCKYLPSDTDDNKYKCKFLWN